MEKVLGESESVRSAGTALRKAASWVSRKTSPCSDTGAVIIINIIIIINNNNNNITTTIINIINITIIE